MISFKISETNFVKFEIIIKRNYKNLQNKVVFFIFL